MQKKTVKLYDTDAYRTTFSSTVLSSEKDGDTYRTVLAETLFFPEEGGQACDTGTLNGEPVLHVSLEDNGVIVHHTALPFTTGEAVTGSIEFGPRFRKMQHHTGEHLLSGIAHRLYGAENVGFHLGEDDVTMDLSCDLDRYALNRIEELANEAVAKNLPVSASYPAPEVLESMTYRSKLDLKENVRIVEIEGYDACACCAPHVARTGEIGLIKILDFMRYKGGVRLHIVCGMDALLDYRKRYEQALAISNLLSAKQNEIVEAVTDLQKALHDEKHGLNLLKDEILKAEIASLPCGTASAHLTHFAPLLDARRLRELVNVGVARTSGIFAAFTGNDEDGYYYVIGSRTIPLRAVAPRINTALNGRGGGSPEMIQGSVRATKAEITAFLSSNDLT